MPRACFRLFCLSTTSLLLALAQQSAVSGYSEAENFSTICTFTLEGQPTQSNGSAAIQHTAIDCSASSPVQLRIAPILRPFLSAFIGVEATVDESMADAASPNAPPTALIAMDGVSVRVTDSRFEGLHVPQDTLLLVTNGSLLVQNTTFTRNQAALHAAFMAQEMLHVSVQRSTFSSSAGVQGIVSIEGSSANSSLSVNVSTFISNRGRAVSSSAMSNNISNSLFKHNTAVTSGPAVYMGGSSRSIVVEKSVFSSNSGANGSAIYVNASLKAGISKTLAIYDSIMENNVATDAVSNTCGGGIASGPGVTSVTLDNVTMANNKADKGGSVCILGRCKISISSSSFRNSTGTGYGGALFVDQTSSSNLSTAITISSAFLNNTAPSGGAIHIITSSNNISIHNSLFEGNAAPSGESTDPLIAEGGAITIVDIAGTSASQLQLTNSTIQHNWADLGSGGVSLDGVQGLLVQSCIFLNNSAVTDPDYAGPGALSFTATCHRAAAQVKSGATEPVLLACQAGFVDSVFQDNFAAVDGAVLLTQNGFLVYMTNTRFATNQALWGTGAISMLQAALDAAGSILLMSEMLFQGNEVTNQTSDTKLDTYNSGAIYLSDVSCFAVVDSNFDSNTGWSFITGVGALNVDKLAGDPEECYRQTKASLPPSLSFYPELFDPTHLLVSTPDQPDGYLQATSADIRNTSFTNHYGGLAGCIELGRSFDPNATFSYCTFHNNTSAGPAGSLMSWLGPYLLVTQCNFTDQHADYDGGAIYTKRAGLEVNGSHFQNCSATRSGGAVATEKAQLIITHSSVRDSSAGPQGGGVAACVACAAVVFTQSDFFNNTSDNVGGVLKADTDTRVIVFKQVQAIGNRALSGGVVHVPGKAATGTTGSPSYGTTVLYIANCTFTSNQADASSSEALNTVSATYGTLAGCGGAVNFIGAALWIQHSTFTDNGATTLGGALMYQQSCPPVDQPLFDLNMGPLDDILDVYSWEGLALSQYFLESSNHTCSTLMLANVTLSDNEAVGAGGSFFINNPLDFHNFCPEDIGTGAEDWVQYTFTDDPLISPVTRLDTSDRVIPTEAPKLCAAWTTYNSQRKRYSGGFSEGYGPVVAYPAKRLQAQCHENRTQQLDGGYACDLVAGLPVISNFWSTNAADETTDEALSRLLVDVRVLDDINQTVTIDYPRRTSFQVQANATDENYLSGQYSTVVDPGSSLASFSGLLLHASNGSYDIKFQAINHAASINSSKITVVVRPCMPGEVPGSNNSTCNKCPSGQYSFNPANATCDVCPGDSDTAKCTATSQVLSLEGHWHSGPQSTLIHPCPNPQACQGNRTEMLRCWEPPPVAAPAGLQPASSRLASRAAPCSLRLGQSPESWANATASEKYLDWQCSEGYQGRLCTVCQDQYGASGRFQCAKCSSTAVSIIEYVAMLTGVLLLNLYLISQLSRASMSDFNTVQGSDYLQGFQLYLQLMSILEMLNVNWPPVMAHLFAACGYATNLTPQVVPLDCLIHATGLPVRVGRTIIQMVVPIIMMGILMLAVCIYSKAVRQAGDPDWLRRHLKITAFSVAGYFYPSLSQAALNIFSCFPVDSPIPAHQPYQSYLQATWHHGYWVLDMSNKCFHGWHLTFALAVGVPGILLCCVGIPLASLLVLCRKVFIKHDKLDNPEIIMDVGFLYRSYSYENGLWWEGPAFQLKVTALLLIVIMGQPLGTYIQSLIVLAMLATELVRQSSTRVIRFRRLRQLQICTIAVLFFSLLVTLFTADYQFTASPGALQALAVFNIIGILALCLVFLAYIVLGYKDKAAGWLVSGKRHLKASASRSRGLKQFVTSPSRMGRQPSSDPMLLSGMTSPASSSFQMSRAASGHAPGDMRRSSSVLSSQDIAALWSGTDATRTQGN